MNPKTKSKKYYCVYKTTNLINNKIYVGFHSTNNLNDGYLGSGKIIKDAIKRYGKENFTREIIQIFDNREDAEKLEAEIVNEEFTSRDDTYNITLGGNVRVMVGENNPWFGKSHPPELIDQITKNRVSTFQNRGYVRTTPTNYWFSLNGVSFYSREQVSRHFNIHKTSPKLNLTIYQNIELIDFVLPTAKEYFTEWYDDYIKRKQSEKEKRQDIASKRFRGVPKSESHRKKIGEKSLGRDAFWIQETNRNQEKIKKTAETHRGMKRSDDAKINISLSNHVNSYFTNIPSNGDILIHGTKYILITPFGKYSSINDIPSNFDKKKVVIASYMGYNDRQLTSPMRKKYIEFFRNSECGVNLKELGWSMEIG